MICDNNIDSAFLLLTKSLKIMSPYQKQYDTITSLLKDIEVYQKEKEEHSLLIGLSKEKLEIFKKNKNIQYSFVDNKYINKLIIENILKNIKNQVRLKKEKLIEYERKEYKKREAIVTKQYEYYKNNSYLQEYEVYIVMIKIK
jgi:hypothetical protein